MGIFDRPRSGKHFEDRLQRILGTCYTCGLYRDVKSTYHGQAETHREHLVQSADRVQLTPHYELYGLHVNPSVLPKVRSMGPQFALALNVPSATVQVDGDTVFIRVPREGATAGLSFDAAMSLAPDMPKGALLLGQCDDGQQAALDMTGGNVHCAVIGMTGSGKSTLMRTMILSAQMTGGCRLALLDPTPGFEPLSGHRSVMFGGMFRTAEDIEAALAVLAGRVREGREQGLTYVFVDEVPSLIRESPGIREHLATIAERGRHIRMHLVLGAQHPLVSELGAVTWRNVAARLVGKVSDKNASYNATGQNESGAERLRGNGDMIAATTTGLAHFQAAMPSEAQLNEWARRYPPKYGTIIPNENDAVFLDNIVRAETATMQSAALMVGGGDVGRPELEPSRRAICWVADYIREHGEPPSLTLLYQVTKQWYRKAGGYGRPRAKRTIELAMELCK